MNVSMKLACSAAIVALTTGSSRAAVSNAATNGPTEATLICRQAYAGETATARMATTSTTLVCRPIAVSMRAPDGSMKILGDIKAKPRPGPDLSNALTPAQVQEACQKWLEALFHISHTS